MVRFSAAGRLLVFVLPRTRLVEPERPAGVVLRGLSPTSGRAVSGAAYPGGDVTLADRGLAGIRSRSREVRLTLKQERFVAGYLISLNATQAATRAGYSRKTAYSIGEENLRKPEIAVAINEAQAKLSIRNAITRGEVIEGLRAEARNTGEGSSHSARVAAWTQLGKHLGMFKDKIEHSGGMTLEQLILGSMRPRNSDE